MIVFLRADGMFPDWKTLTKLAVYTFSGRESREEESDMLLNAITTST